jgi:hypothetical protein
MHSVTIVGKFTTGTTVDDYDKARQMTKDLLLRKLKEAGITSEEPTSGLFEFKVLEVNSETLPPKPLGPVERGGRGFEYIEFDDAYNFKCSLQQSSAIADDTATAMQQPGSSAIWLGVDEVQPKIMAKHAAKLGVETTEVNGWIAYPAPKLPEEVQLSGRMHLTRVQVERLVSHLQQWLKTGSLEL